MPIEITFHANTAAEIRQQMLVFLNLPVPSTTSPGLGAQRVAEPAEKRAPQRNSKQAAPIPSPEPRPQPEPQPESRPQDLGEIYDEEEAETPMIDALANEKLKAETISQLQTLFSSGKVKVVRHVLDKYGNGAKSFPEIDASQFPLIADALKRGEAA